MTLKLRELVADWRNLADQSDECSKHLLKKASENYGKVPYEVAHLWYEKERAIAGALRHTAEHLEKTIDSHDNQEKK